MSREGRPQARSRASSPGEAPAGADCQIVFVFYFASSSDELRCEPVRSTQMLDINVNQADRIATLTLNRPEKRNALSLEFMHQLTCALADIGQRSDVGVVILSANGPVFSSGHDLAELVDRSPRDYQRVFDQCVELMGMIQRIP